MSTQVSMFPSFPSTYLPELRRESMGRLFGSGIEECRKQAGLSVEEAARLAGMEFSKWVAIEAGSVPQTTNQLRAMADAMEVGYEKLLNLVALCRDAWEL